MLSIELYGDEGCQQHRRGEGGERIIDQEIETREWERRSLGRLRLNKARRAPLIRYMAHLVHVFYKICTYSWRRKLLDFKRVDQHYSIEVSSITTFSFFFLFGTRSRGLHKSVQHASTEARSRDHMCHIGRPVPHELRLVGSITAFPVELNM